MYILRGDIPEIDVIYTGAVLHIQSHSGAGGDIVKGKLRIGFKLAVDVRAAL